MIPPQIYTFSNSFMLHELFFLRDIKLNFALVFYIFWIVYPVKTQI